MFVKWFYDNINLMYQEDQFAVFNNTTLEFFDFYYVESQIRDIEKVIKNFNKKDMDNFLRMVKGYEIN